jgi:hypothetical protein
MEHILIPRPIHHRSFKCLLVYCFTFDPLSTGATIVNHPKMIVAQVVYVIHSSLPPDLMNELCYVLLNLQLFLYL